jgi:hypothetical protein
MLTHDYRTTLLVSLGQLDHPLGETVNKNSRFLETSMTHPDYTVAFRYHLEKRSALPKSGLNWIKATHPFRIRTPP